MQSKNDSKYVTCEECGSVMDREILRKNDALRYYLLAYIVVKNFGFGVVNCVTAPAHIVLRNAIVCIDEN